MILSAYRVIAGLLLGIIFTGCNPSQEAPPPPTASTDQAPPPQAAQQRAPRPQPLSLFMVPLNPGDFSMQAIQDNKKRIEERPDDIQALMALGDANFMIQRFDVAMGYYERALKADQNLVNARLSLSNCYLFPRGPNPEQRSNPDKAIAQLDSILTAHKDYPEALYNKGLILLQSKQDPGGAKKIWTQLVSSHPEHRLAQQVQREMNRL